MANRFGQTRTGRAVLRGPCGWVLNMGGPHGTPAVATEETIEQVQPQGSKAIGHWRRSSLMTTDKAATAISDRRGGDQDGDNHLGHDRHGGDQSMALTRRRPRDWSRRSSSL